VVSDPISSSVEQLNCTRKRRPKINGNKFVLMMLALKLKLRYIYNSKNTLKRVFLAKICLENFFTCSNNLDKPENSK
jgi:hypothetical protein